MRSSFLFASLVLAAACGGDDAPGGPDAGDDGPDADTSRTVIGSIDLVEDLHFYDDGTGGLVESRLGRASARFFDGRPPSFHREAMRSGACTLSVYGAAQCTPACTTGLCVDDDVCEAWPTQVSAGRLTVAGLEVALTIDPQDGYYYPDAQLPDDLFADDATVTASLAGAELPAATLEAGAVAPIVAEIVDGKITVPYPAGDDFVIRWTPAGDDSRVRVTLNSNNDGHGYPYRAILTCDVADAAGQVALPAAMLDAFPETEAWKICAGTDCPPSTIARYRRDGAPVGADQEIELRVVNQLSFGVIHPRP